MVKTTNSADVAATSTSWCCSAFRHHRDVNERLGPTGRLSCFDDASTSAPNNNNHSSISNRYSDLYHWAICYFLKSREKSCDMPCRTRVIVFPAQSSGNLSSVLLGAQKERIPDPTRTYYESANLCTLYGVRTFFNREVLISKLYSFS